MSDRQAPAVAVIPYEERLKNGLSRLPLDALHWPLGRPERLGKGTVADMAPQDHLITFPKTRLYLARPVPPKLTLMIVEPDSIHRRHLRLVRLFAGRFYRVLTKNAALLAAMPNAQKFVFGTSHIAAPEAVDTTKHAMVSLIASSRAQLPGHKLRHHMVDHIRAHALDVAIMGRGYRPFVPKEEGLAPFRYSVVIENSVEASYFSEKLVDALLCRTVPIYWGAPDIADYFDPAGLIQCADAASLKAALSQVSVEDYAARAQAIEENRARALRYTDLEGRAARLVLDPLAKGMPTRR